MRLLLASILTGILLCAEARAQDVQPSPQPGAQQPQTDGTPPWWGLLTPAGVCAVIALLWKTSEAKNAKILEITERAVAAIQNNNSVLTELKNALNKD